ncbi:MAG: ABC transporter permease [Ilumatobacteraceae bacterium]
MSPYLQFAVLGLAAGSVYAAMSAALVSIYRATGIINFAQGSMAMWGPYVYWRLSTSGDLVLPIGTVHIGSTNRSLALTVALAAAVAIALLAHLLVFRPLRRAPVLAQVVASVGLMLVMQSLVVLRFGSLAVVVDRILTSRRVTVAGAVLPVTNLVLAAVTVVGAAVLHLYFRITRRGVATRACSEDELAVRFLGYSPDRLAAIIWVLTGAFVGIVATLAAPSIGLNPTTYMLFVVPALAVALVGRLTSISVACVAGLVLGCFQAVVGLLRTTTWWPDWAKTGVQDAVPFVIVIVALFAVGKKIPTRGSLEPPRLPAVHVPRLRASSLGIAVAIALVLVLVTSGNYRFGVVTSMILVVLALSLVLLTGYLGQISLAQMSIAGVAGFALSKATTNWGVPFPLSIVLAAAIATGAGVLVGIPALRIRGAQLAVVTLAAAVAVEQFVFNNPNIASSSGNPIKPPRLFGINLSIRHGSDVSRPVFAVMVLVIMVVIVVAVVQLMRGDTGRAFLAVRSNERAAASVGIDVAFAKLAGFGLSAFIAGIAGSLIGYSRGQLSAESFTVLAGLSLLAVAYLGGITSIGGAVVAGVTGPLGIGYVFFAQTLDLGRYYALVSGLGLILTAIINPVGVAGALAEMAHSHRRRLSRRDGSAPTLGAAIPTPTDAELHA